jgi:hypothetical protein
MDFGTLWRDGVGFWRTWIVTLGKRHGLFDGLDRPPRNRAVGVWRDAARALGLLVRRGGRLRPAPGVRETLLDPRSPRYVAGHLMFGALRSLDYDAMGELFRSGRGIPLLKRPRRNEAIEEATDWDHGVFLRKLPREIRGQLRRGADVLELGCGTGRWLKRMRTEFPRSRFRGVDPDPDTGAERGFAETAGKTASVDVVYLGEVLMVTDRKRTLANCARVLRPGGRLLVLEAWLPERVSTGKWDAPLFAMQLDEALQGVAFMMRSELRLPRGFTKPRFTPFGGCVALADAVRR